jgi:hypothetical protein
MNDLGHLDPPDDDGTPGDSGTSEAFVCAGTDDVVTFVVVFQSASTSVSNGQLTGPPSAINFLPDRKRMPLSFSHFSTNYSD